MECTRASEPVVQPGSSRAIESVGRRGGNRAIEPVVRMGRSGAIEQVVRRGSIRAIEPVVQDGMQTGHGAGSANGSRRAIEPVVRMGCSGESAIELVLSACWLRIGIRPAPRSVVPTLYAHEVCHEIAVVLVQESR